MSETPLESFSRFNYLLLSPSKQVERKVFIEALHRLALGNFRTPRIHIPRIRFALLRGIYSFPQYFLY